MATGLLCITQQQARQQVRADTHWDALNTTKQSVRLYIYEQN